ncbi:aldose epimerase family protein [Aestuariimicrobium ganziense]|uniref:aldose epimerase family protein n=1 Tax=Aestuariimicrobium ganziense TaxID=2773677 RepID=UPI00194067AF|nr:hypothetical protein [Aestuariimicrobium ganziense]
MTVFTVEGFGNHDHHWFVADHGAQVMAWQPFGNHQRVLWSAPDDLWEVSPDDPDGGVLRGGIPTCLPWFGRADEPLHGTARRHTWERLEAELVDMELHTTHWLLLDGLEATQRVTMTGHDLQVRVSITNTGDQPRRVEAAHHTYLAVGGVDSCRISGLGGTPVWDAAADTVGTQPEGDLLIGPNTDRVHVADGPLELVDDPWQRTIRIEREGFPQVVVWNSRPAVDAGLGVTNDRWDEFVCIESAMVREHALDLASGATHELLTRISLV